MLSVYRRIFNKSHVLFGLSIFTALMFTSCITSSEITDGIVNAKTIWLCFLAGLAVFYVIYYYNWQINCFDLMLLVVTTYVITNNVAHFHNLFSATNIENLALFIIAIFIKVFLNNKGNKKRFQVIFLITLLVQLIVATMQWRGIIPTFNNNFKITGFFFNPLPFSIFIAGLIGYSLPLCFNPKTKFRYAYTIVTILAIMLEIILFSRSAWLGIFIAFVIVILPKISSKRLFSNNLLKLSFITLSIISFFLVSYKLYLLKKDSADGRLLSWKISTYVFFDHPVTGQGQGSLKASFLKYQSLYFQHHPKKMSTEGRIAGEVAYSYNDILQYGVEQGIIGLILILTVFILVIRVFILINHKQKEKGDDLSLYEGAGLCFIILTVSGLFSYPLSILPIRIIYFVSLGILSSFYAGNRYFINIFRVNRNDFHYPKLKAVIGLLCLTCFFCYGLAYYDALRLSKKISDNRLQNSLKDWNKLEKYRYLGKNEEWFVFPQVANDIECREYSKAINQLEQLKIYSNNVNVYYTLSNLYFVSKNYLRAEQQLTFIYYALPGLIRPKYKLAMFFFESGQQLKWVKMANETINFKPKVISILGESMQHEIYFRLNKTVE